MIRSKTMIATVSHPNETYWTETYRARQIAAFRHGSQWHVYLDRVLQKGRSFETVEDAASWLRRSVDGLLPSLRPWRDGERPRAARSR